MTGATQLYIQARNRAIPVLLRSYYDLQACVSWKESIKNCGHSAALPEWTQAELQLYGEEVSRLGIPGAPGSAAASASLYWHTAAASGECGPGGWQGQRVLELGCGLGGGARFLSVLLRPHTYVATDFSFASVALSRWRHRRLLKSLPTSLSYRCIDATQLRT